jgi:hypothetical protein
MNWLVYCWDHPYQLERHGESFVLNKLYIDKDFLSYKTERYEMAPGVFEDLEEFYEILYRGKPKP